MIFPKLAWCGRLRGFRIFVNWDCHLPRIGGRKNTLEVLLQCQPLIVTSFQYSHHLLNTQSLLDKVNTTCQEWAIQRSWCFLNRLKGGTKAAAQYKSFCWYHLKSAWWNTGSVHCQIGIWPFCVGPTCKIHYRTRRAHVLHRVHTGRIPGLHKHLWFDHISPGSFA